MLDQESKIDIRRHLSLPFAGVPATGLTMGIRTLFEAGQLESYMDNLQPQEESVLTGRPYGSLQIYGTVVAGSSVTVTINGTPVTYTATDLDAVNVQSPLQAVANGLSGEINLAAVANGTGNIFSGGNAYKQNQVAQLPGYGYVILVSTVQQAFTMTANATNGLSVGVIANGATLPNPKFTFVDMTGTTITVVGYIAYCNYLESSLIAVVPNLGLLAAGGPGVAEYRPYELKQRIELYDTWRAKMARVLSVSKDAWGFRGANNGSRQGGASA